jgi:hypothetical protein
MERFEADFFSTFNNNQIPNIINYYNALYEHPHWVFQVAHVCCLTCMPEQRSLSSHARLFLFLSLFLSLSSLSLLSFSLFLSLSLPLSLSLSLSLLTLAY